MNLTMAAFLQMSLVLTGADVQDAPQKGTYDWAHQEVSKTGGPMFVLVGAKWCPACVKMKEKVVPVIKRRGLFRKVAYAYVDLDKEKRLGRELTNRGPIPQMIMFRKTAKGWVQDKVIGGRSVEAVETFIQKAVAAGRKGKEGDPKRSKAQGADPASSQSSRDRQASGVTNPFPSNF